MTAADPEGRVRHLLDVMHKTFDDAGDPIAAGMVPVADGLGQVDYVDSSTFGSGLPWFIVTAYGAVGDGTTDDTTAINAAIAALVSAGRGVLYFPAGTYKTTGALTALSVPCLVLGDGGAYTDPATKITGNHGTAHLLTLSQHGIHVSGIHFAHTGSAPTAGSAIHMTAGDGAAFDDLTFAGFYINLDVEDGNVWTMDRCFNSDGVLYGARLRHTDLPDGGDWTISNSWFGSTVGSSALIRYETGGGGKITNCKMNGGSTLPVHGIDLAIPTGVNTVDFLITNTSIENVSGDAIHVTTTGTGSFAQIVINGIQCGLFSNNTGRAVNIVAASAGGHVSGGIADIIIDSCVFMTDGTARAAVAITNVDNITFGDLTLVGFNARYTATTSTNITDGASITYATPAIVLGTAAAAGAASSVIRSDSTIIAFDATVPTTIAFSDAAATGSAAVAARRDHRHGAPASPAPDTTTYGIHAHIVSETHLSNGSVTTYTLDNAIEPGTVIAWNTSTLARLGVVEAQPDQATVSAAGSSGDSIVFDYATPITV